MTDLILSMLAVIVLGAAIIWAVTWVVNWHG